MQLVYGLSIDAAVAKEVKFLPFSIFTVLQVIQRRHRNSNGASFLWKNMSEFVFYIDQQDFSGNTEPIRCLVGANS